MPEQAKHRLLRLLRFKIKSQEHAESPIVFPGENGERQYRSPKALHSKFLRFPSASRMRAISAPACKRRGHARFCSIAALYHNRLPRSRGGSTSTPAFFAEPGLIGVHPNDNTATVWLRADDLAALIREHGNPVHIAEL